MEYKEHRIDAGDGLTIDIGIHEALGMRILTKAEVDARPKAENVIEWPKDTPFDPPGITFEQAREACRRR